MAFRKISFKFICEAIIGGCALCAGAVEFPDPAQFNPTWESAKPGTSYSTDLPTGALLGNGSLGAVNGGDGNHKHFVLTRGDIWSCGDFTNGTADNNVRPISFADFSIGPGMHSVKSTDTLDLPTATLRTEGGFGKGRVKIETYVASTEDLLVVTGVSDTDDNWAVHLIAHRERKSFPVEVKSFLGSGRRARDDMGEDTRQRAFCVCHLIQPVAPLHMGRARETQERPRRLVEGMVGPQPCHDGRCRSRPILLRSGLSARRGRALGQVPTRTLRYLGDDGQCKVAQRLPHELQLRGHLLRVLRREPLRGREYDARSADRLPAACDTQCQGTASGNRPLPWTPLQEFPRISRPPPRRRERH